MDDKLENLAIAMQLIANALRDPNAEMGRDAAGGLVNSLLEAVMGITAGLYEVGKTNVEAADMIETGLQQTGRSIENGLENVAAAIQAFVRVYEEKN